MEKEKQFIKGNLVKINAFYFTPPNSIGLVIKKERQFSGVFGYKVWIPKTSKLKLLFKDEMEIIK